MHLISVFVSSISDLIFPNNCLVCEHPVPRNQMVICPFCIDELPYTYFERYSSSTPFDQLFYGRANVYSTYALLYFEQHNSTQRVLHALKYDSRKLVGLQMGIEIGTRLKEKQAIDPIDVLIPVPIHPKKAFDRGYNQSEWIAKGIASVIPAEIQKNWMVKNHHTKSQTRSNRFNRWDNVSTNFSSRIIDTFEGHIAIVDDVITTGATIEAMVSAIQAKNKKVKISVITLAITK